MQSRFGTIRIVLRFVELAFSLIVLGTSAYLVDKSNGSFSKVNFTLFTGLTSMLVCGLIIVLNFSARARELPARLTEVILTGIYWVFWLAAAASMADFTRVVNDWSSAFNGFWIYSYSSNDGGSFVDVTRACCAFAWLTWFLWCVSLFFCIYEDLIKSNTSTGPKPTTAPQPQQNPGSQPMVSSA